MAAVSDDVQAGNAPPTATAADGGAMRLHEPVCMLLEDACACN